MQLNSWTVLSLGVVGMMIVIISLGSNVEGKSLRQDADNTPHVIRKRNAWWSKKSTDDSRINSGQVLSDRTMGAIREAVDCYTEDCVPAFTWCGRQMDTESDFIRCKYEHRLCAARCFGDASSGKRI